MAKPKPKPAPDSPAAAFSRRNDGFENLITGLGVKARDKRMGTTAVPPAASVTREQFESYYLGDDIAATIAELPAQELVREWIDLKIDASEDDRGVRMGGSEDGAKMGKQILQSLADLDAQAKFAEALTWRRVYGGGLIMVGADDGVSDPRELAQPLNENAIRKIDFLTVFDRFDVEVASVETDPAKQGYGMPTAYRITAPGTPAEYANQPIHASRFLRFDGIRVSRRRRQQNGGWGDSVYSRMEQTILDFGSAWGSIAHMFQDFAQTVFRVKDLAAMVGSDNDDLVLKRVTQMDLCRSVARLVLIDADHEDFQRIQTPIAGLDGMIDRFSHRIAAAARMPVTLLFGNSPGGLNATGESDIRLFYDRIAAEQDTDLRSPLERLIRLIMLSAQGPTRGREPENWSMTFNPLWQMSDKEKAEVRKLQADTDSLYLDRGVISEDEIAVSRFGGDSYSTETILDAETRTAPEVRTEPGGDLQTLPFGEPEGEE